MALDGLVIGGLSQELNCSLLGSRIDKIYQPEKTQFILAIKTKSGNKKLLLSCNSDHPGVYFTNTSYENPQTPSALCMFFRKHLQGARITLVNQYESERILEICIDSLDELGEMVSKKVIVELMGRYSNILLVQTDTDSKTFPHGKILDSAKRGSLDSNTSRLVLPGQPYEYPPSKDKISFKTLADSISSNTNEASTNFASMSEQSSFSDPSFIVSNFQGISINLAGQIASTSNPFETFTTYVNSLQEGKYTPTVWINANGSPKDIHVIDLDIYQNLEKKEFEDTSQALDFYYLSRSSSNKIDQEKLILGRSIRSLLKKISVKKGKLANEVETAKNSEHLRIYGELLMANLHSFKTGDSFVEVQNYYDNSLVTIPLDIKISPAKNAQEYFKRYSKSKTAIEEKGKQLQKASQEIEYLESVSTFLDMTSSIDEINNIREELIESQFLRKDKSKKNAHSKKKQKVSLLSYELTSGRTVFVGRNNKENEHVTFSVAGRKDLWFHTKSIPGSHVVLKLDGEEATESEILETAAIAAYYSKGSASENVAVDYVPIKNIKKIPNGKPGMVIFSSNNTVYVNPVLPKHV